MFLLTFNCSQIIFEFKSFLGRTGIGFKSYQDMFSTSYRPCPLWSSACVCNLFVCRTFTCIWKKHIIIKTTFNFCRVGLYHLLWETFWIKDIVYIHVSNITLKLSFHALFNSMVVVLIRLTVRFVVKPSKSIIVIANSVAFSNHQFA
jgi:hypothetical protein